MFDFKEDKQKRNEKEKLKNGAYTFVIIGIALVLLGTFLLIPAFAVNQTAINEIQADLTDELDHGLTFSVFYIVFLLVVLAVFMLVSIVRKVEREMVFFAIGAVIVSFVLTLLFISTASFDYITTENIISITEIESPTDGSLTYNVSVDQASKSVQVIPWDPSMRMSLSLLFGGIALFNGLYAILILTYFPQKGKLGL